MGSFSQKIVLFTVSLWLSDIFLIEYNTRLVGCCFVGTFRIEMWHPLWTTELYRIQDGSRKCLLNGRKLTNQKIFDKAFTEPINAFKEYSYNILEKRKTFLHSREHFMGYLLSKLLEVLSH